MIEKKDSGRMKKEETCRECEVHIVNSIPFVPLTQCSLLLHFGCVLPSQPSALKYDQLH